MTATATLIKSISNTTLMNKTVNNTKSTGIADITNIKGNSNNYDTIGDPAVSSASTDRTMQNKSNDIKVWNNHLTQLGNTQSRESFKILFNHFSPLLKNYFIAKFPSQHSYQMIDELIQEVMIKVWRKASSYDSRKAAASTWIFTLARNTRIDMLRRQNKYAGTSSIEVEDIWEDTTEDGPYTLLQHKRDEENIKQSLKKLPQEQATVIRKVYMEAKSHSEVAIELNLPLGTIKSRVRLAQNKLQSLLENEISPH